MGKGFGALIDGVAYRIHRVDDVGRALIVLCGQFRWVTSFEVVEALDDGQITVAYAAAEEKEDEKKEELQAEESRSGGRRAKRMVNRNG